MKNNIISFLSFIGILSALMLSFISVYSSGFALIDPKFHRALCCGLALITVVLLPYRKLENISDFITSKIVLDFFIVVFGILTVFKFYTVQAILEIELYEVSYFDGLYSILGLIIFIEVCRRSWGYALFFVGLFSTIAILHSCIFVKGIIVSPFVGFFLTDSIAKFSSKKISLFK